MVALAQALLRDMTPFKKTIFETLDAAAVWPSVRGRVAGSGVLGVVVATMLAPQQRASTKALMVRLASHIVVDAVETKRLGDEKREAEFSKLRAQLISSGAVKAFASMVHDSSKRRKLAVATANAIAALADAGGDGESRRALIEARAVEALPSKLPGWDVGDCVFEAKGDKANSATVTASNLATEGNDASEQEQGAGGSDSAGSASAALEDSAEEESEDDVLSAALSALTTVAACSGENAEQLRTPLREPKAIERLSTLFAKGSPHTEGISQAALRCVVSLRRTSTVA